MRTALAVYCLSVAVLMSAWWSVDIGHGALSRRDRAPAEIRLHVGAELMTALLLAGGAITLLAGGRPLLLLVGLGMLLYTVVASPGYFLARHELPPVAMFAGLSVLTVVAIAATLAL